MSKNVIEVSGEFTRVEHVVGAASIYPGMLCMVNSDDEIVVHATEGGECEVLIPMEDVFAGNTVDDVLTDGERAQCLIPHSGAVFQGLLESGQTVTIGENLVSAGNGKFIAEDAATSSGVVKKVIGIAREACDLSGSSDADTLIKIRRL